MTQFVLVPGEWLGGWAWRKVRVRLEAAGHSVWTPTLTGLGERSHLAGPSVGLETHVDDVANVIGREGLDELVLAGHGYGGVVATAVADRLPRRVARLVLVASPVPQDGRSFLGVADPWVGAAVDAGAKSIGDVPAWPIPSSGELGEHVAVADMDDADRSWFWANAAPHPLRALERPVNLGGEWTGIPTTYVRCLADEAVGGFAPDLPAEWTVRSMHAGHWPMVTRPDELTDILREAGEPSLALPQSMVTRR